GGLGGRRGGVLALKRHEDIEWVEPEKPADRQHGDQSYAAELDASAETACRPGRLAVLDVAAAPHVSPAHDEPPCLAPMQGLSPASWTSNEDPERKVGAATRYNLPSRTDALPVKGRPAQARAGRWGCISAGNRALAHSDGDLVPVPPRRHVARIKRRHRVARQVGIRLRPPAADA